MSAPLNLDSKVAIVTEPRRPARVMISASCWWNFALRTVWMIPARLSMRESTSDASTLVVPPGALACKMPPMA